MWSQLTGGGWNASPRGGWNHADGAWNQSGGSSPRNEPRNDTIPADDEILRILDRREKARRDKEYKRADSIREDLRIRGVTLLDNRGTFGEVEWSTSDGRKGAFQGSAAGK
jgi:hypothetical protein